MSISIYSNNNDGAAKLIGDGLLGLKILEDIKEDNLSNALSNINGLNFEPLDQDAGFFIQTDNIQSKDILKENTKVDFYIQGQKSELEIIAEGSLDSSTKNAVKSLNHKPSEPTEESGPGI